VQQLGAIYVGGCSKKDVNRIMMIIITRRSEQFFCFCFCFFVFSCYGFGILLCPFPLFMFSFVCKPISLMHVLHDGLWMD
jgi:hypothetical protein